MKLISLSLSLSLSAIVPFEFYLISKCAMPANIDTHAFIWWHSRLSFATAKVIPPVMIAPLPIDALSEGMPGRRRVAAEMGDRLLARTRSTTKALEICNPAVRGKTVDRFAAATAAVTLQC
jgi:hypothetical protein